MALRKRTYTGERRHRHHHHHSVGGTGVHHHHHVHHRTHHRLNSWQNFVRQHMRPGMTLKRVGEMYRHHTGRPKTRTATHHHHHRHALSW